jgi:DNA-binding transcriptional ArsR family regulator
MATSIVQQFETLCTSLSAETRQHHLRRWDNLQWLDPYALQELLQNGHVDIVQDPGLLTFIRGLYDDESSYIDAEPILAVEEPFRKAWIEALSSTLDNLSRPAEWTDRIFSLVAQERITSRSFLEARLQVSQATLSRAIQVLRDDGLIVEEPISTGPGRPVKAISLTQGGLQRARELDIPASPAPNQQSIAIAERFFHQHIAAIYFNAFPSISVRRAYTESPTQVDTPLGSIYPDLVIQNSQGDLEYIEAESGTYEYKRLRDKLDKYLASQINELQIVTESQRGPTASHIRQWVHDRNVNPLETIPAGAHLRIRCTSIDQLQRSGPEGDIWQVFRFGPNLEPPRPTVESHPAPRLRELFLEWKRSMDSDEFAPGYFSLEEPFILRDDRDQEVDRLQADIVLFMAQNAIAQVYLEQPTDWNEEHIQRFLRDFDRFLKSGDYLLKKHRTYPHYHWLYGVVHLVHTTTEETSPERLAFIYDRWRQASLAFQLTYGYPLTVRVAHVETLRGHTYLDVPEMGWELSGML